MKDCIVCEIGQSIYQRVLGLYGSPNKGEQTRERILEAAFEEMYIHGYQGMRIENILHKTGLAKGALYHHFPSKLKLGYAVVDEVIMASRKALIAPLEDTEDPITTACEILQSTCNNTTDAELKLGCPLNNLAQEMCNLDKGFNERLNAVYLYWRDTLAQALERGQDKGNVSKSINPKNTALFVISAIQGVIGTAKCMQSARLFDDLIKTLCDYLRSLRA